MSKLTPGAFGTERQKPSAPVRPPGPVLGDREPLVSLTATLGAAHDDNVGTFATHRRARHMPRLRLVCSPREQGEVAAGTARVERHHHIDRSVHRERRQPNALQGVPHPGSGDAFRAMLGATRRGFRVRRSASLIRLLAAQP
jgi:hypothetical protein